MTQKFGLIGYPLTHSFSRRFFTEKFQQESIDAEYLNFEIPEINRFPDIISNTENLKGLNVTIPYKEQIIPFLNEIDDAAKAIGAVNTIRIGHHAKGVVLRGFNTDVIGFRESIRPLLQPHHRRALVLGTGGASKAVLFALKALNIDPVQVSRTPFNSQSINYNDLSKEMIDSHTVIVNTTPLGTFPKIDTFPPIPYQWLGASHLLYDLVYNPEETAFLRRGKERGVVIKNGLEMLHLQALAAWEIWNS